MPETTQTTPAATAPAAAATEDATAQAALADAIAAENAQNTAAAQTATAQTANGDWDGKIESLPPQAQKIISDLRKEAGDHRKPQIA